MERRVKRGVWGVIAAGMLAWPLPVDADGLKVDGMLRVQGMNMDSARVIVVGGSQGPILIEKNAKSFQVELEWNQEYLIAFERPGCVGKEILVSTHLPESVKREKVPRLPLRVVLAPPSHGKAFNYSGPVGHLRYDDRAGEFRYGPDHRTSHDRRLQGQLDAVRYAIAAGGALPKAGAAGTTPAESSLLERTGTDVFTTLAPTVGRTSPLVQTIEIPAQSEVERVLPHLLEAIPMEQMDEPVLELESVQMVAPTDAMGEPGRTTVQTREVQAGKLYLITTVRVGEGDNMEEYRRVVSYYGGTTYFKNGSPCSAHTYVQGTTR